jgi:hypothetical protein
MVSTGITVADLKMAASCSCLVAAVMEMPCEN